MQRFAKRIDRAGADVAIDDAKRAEHQEPGPGRGVLLSRLADRSNFAIGWFLDHQRYSDKARAALHKSGAFGKCCNAIASFRDTCNSPGRNATSRTP